MSKDLILEIGTEEVPAGFIPKALDSLAGTLRKLLEEARLDHGGLRKLGTPRRLALVVEGLGERQPDATVEARGPKKDAAFDPDGKPTKALEGFCRGKGVDVKDIETRETDKGEYVYAVKHIEGRDTAEILPGILEKTVSREYFPKSMRWGDHDVSFARPVHWLLAVFGGAPVEFSYGHLTSANVTYGHRFLSEGAIEVAGVKDYVKKLEENHVIVDPAKRKELITKGLDQAAREAGGEVLPDPGLLEEVTYLVEEPVVVKGSFEREFLELPRDVVVNAMREHQRYFSVVDGAGRLLPNFLTVAGTKAKNPDTVRKGNERVLRARLNDAKFYFEKDVSVPLTEWAEKLKGVVFQAKLGTSYEKVTRFTELALNLGKRAGFSEPVKSGEGPEDFLKEGMNPAEYDPGKVDPGFYSKLVLGRAAVLAKADLVTGMVGEFPSLQGVMGSVYARRSGEAEAVATAIYEHYLPTGAGGELPASVPGALVSIADKLDTICGCFGIGLKPTGTADPYALRRQALGIISIILDKGFSIPLDEMVDLSLDILSEKMTEKRAAARDEVLEFFKERLRNMLLGEGLSFDAVDAVLSAPWYDLADAVKRVKALEGFKEHPARPSLVTAFKRVSNILKKTTLPAKEPDPGLFTDKGEKSLWKTSSEIAPVIDEHWKKGDYEKVFEVLASIKDSIDEFFDETMVMVDDDQTRTNRLLLLSYVRNLYYKIADLSRLSG